MPTKPKGRPKGTIEKSTDYEQPSLPNWPPLKPVLSENELYVEETLKEQILVIPTFFTANLCKAFVSFLSTLPLVTTPGKPKRGEAMRVNDRFQIEDDAFATRLWSETALKAIVNSYPDQDIWGGEVIGLNKNIRIYRYKPGQFFDQHYDEPNRVDGPGSVPGITTWTLLIYLTSCEGGETAFYPEPATKRDKQPEPILVNPKAGSALLHRHYPECLLHEGKEVKSGEKWVLRSDIVVKR